MADQEIPERTHRGPFPWPALISGLSELIGLALIGFVLYQIWWPLPLAELGLLLIYLPNRR